MEIRNGSERVSHSLLRLIMRYIELDKRMRNFGTDTPIYHSEIHLISVIADNQQKQYSAEELFGAIANSGHSPGKSTVYRLVSEMADEGLLRRFPKESGRGFRYQYHHGDDCSEHLHLKCRSCGTLIHLECEQSERLLSHISKDHSFTVDNDASVLYGLCGNCKNTAGGNNKL